MTAATNRNRGFDVEDEACECWPAEPLTEDHDGRNGWHDITFVDDVEDDLSGTVIEAGTPGEVKSCRPDYADRAGRWWIRRDTHEQLVEAKGVYVLAVVERETDRILRMALVDAKTVDELIDGDWWAAGNGGQNAEYYRQIPWTRVFDSLDGGGAP